MIHILKLLGSRIESIISCSRRHSGTSSPELHLSQLTALSCIICREERWISSTDPRTSACFQFPCKSSAKHVAVCLIECCSPLDQRHTSLTVRFNADSLLLLWLAAVCNSHIEQLPVLIIQNSHRSAETPAALIILRNTQTPATWTMTLNQKSRHVRDGSHLVTTRLLTPMNSRLSDLLLMQT